MKKKIGLLCVAMVMILTAAACGRAATAPQAAPAAPAEMAAAEEAGFGSYTAGAEYAADMYLADSNVAGEVAMVEAAAEEPVEAAAPADASAAATGAAETGDLSARKLIRDANLTVETEEFDTLMTTVTERVENLGGYLENYSTNKDSLYYGGSQNRYASLTIRIPAAQYDLFVNEVAEISNVLSRNESIRDVTMQYVDLESHKKVLRTEQERLIELLAKAETTQDIILIENRLSEVRYQIESMESQLRTYDNLVDYSTIYLQVNEVKRLTPVAEQTVWEEIGTGFVRSWISLGTGLKNLFIGVIVASPYLIVWGIIIIAIVFILRLILKRYRKGNPGKKRKNKAQPPETAETPAASEPQESSEQQEPRI